MGGFVLVALGYSLVKAHTALGAFQFSFTALETSVVVFVNISAVRSEAVERQSGLGVGLGGQSSGDASAQGGSPAADDVGGPH